MPEISRFFGIIVRMFVEAGGSHHRPHFHAYYQDHVAVIGVDTIELLEGGLPRRQQRWLRRGPSSTKRNCCRTGLSCRVVSCPSGLSRFSRVNDASYLSHC